MTEQLSQDSPAAGLVELADEVRALAVDVQAVLETGHARPAPAELTRRLASLTRLNNHLTAAVETLTGRSDHRRRAAQFAADTWADRRRSLVTAAEDEGLDYATVRRLQWFCEALTEGQWDEAERLSDDSLPISEQLPWLPDRMLAATDAARQALREPARSLARLSDLIELLCVSEPVEPRLAILPRTRFRLRLLQVRLAAAAGAAAVKPLADASTIELAADDPRRSELIAATSLLLRTKGDLGRSIGPMADWDDLAWLAELEPAARTDLGCAVELFVRLDAAPTVDSAPPELDPPERAQQLANRIVDSMDDIFGIVPTARMLCIALPEPMTIALVDRLAAEEQYDDAQRLLAEYPPQSPQPALAAADLQVTLARGGRGELVQALIRRGDRALDARQFELAARSFGEVLELVPGSADAARSQADALVCIVAAEPDSPQALDNLTRALELADQADRAEPVTAGTSWSLLIRSEAHRLLSTTPSEARPGELWKSLAASVRATALAPEDPMRWNRLASCFNGVGAARCASLAAGKHAELEGHSEIADLNWAIQLANAGELDQVRQLLADVNPSVEDDRLRAVRELLRATVAELSSDPRTAEVHLVTAVGLQPELPYRYLLASVRSQLPEAKQRQAESDWNDLWQQADLTEYDGLKIAAWAALQLNFERSAQHLARRLASAEHGLGGDQYGVHLLAVLGLETDTEASWQAVRAALEAVLVPVQLQDTARQLKSSRVAVSRHLPLDERYDALIAERCAALEERFPGHDRLVDALRELDWFIERGSIARDEGWLGEAYAVLGLAAQPAAVEPAPSRPEPAPTIRVAVPPSWFSSWAGRETSHPIFQRALPDARAVLQRGRTEPIPAVMIRVEPDCEPDTVLVELPGGGTARATVPRGSWYYPSDWRDVLLELTVGQALLPSTDLTNPGSDPVTSIPGLIIAGRPLVPLARVALRSPEEVAARFVIGTYLDASTDQQPPG